MRFANYVYYEKFLSKQECNRIIKAKENDLKKAEIGVNVGRTELETRNTKVSFVEENSSVQDLMMKIVNQICFAAHKYYGYSLTTFEPIQYAEYEKGMFYSWHVDSTMQLDEIGLCVRDISASLILNKKTEYTGSSLQFILPNCVSKDNILTPEDAVNQEQGTLIVFPSSMLHQVTPVLTGVRKSLVLWACSDVKPI